MIPSRPFDPGSDNCVGYALWGYGIFNYPAVKMNLRLCNFSSPADQKDLSIMRFIRASIIRSSWTHHYSLTTKLCSLVSNIQIDRSDVYRPEDPITRLSDIFSVHDQVTGDQLKTRSNDLLPVETGRRKKKVLRSRRKVDTQSKLSPNEIVESLAADKRLRNIHDYGSIKIGFQRYKELYGNLVVPYMFTIPVDSGSWPPVTHGMMLGVVASKLRRSGCYQSLRDELAVMGMNFERQIRPFDAETLKISLLRYKDIYGTLRIPHSFCIPESNIWPEKTRGMRLGVLVSTIRRGKSYKYIRDELVGMGFDYGQQKRHHGQKLVMTALQRYKDIFGDLLVPAVYRVPVNSKTEDWPAAVWDMNLGSIVGSIRGGDCHLAIRSKLQEMGFDYTNQKIEYGDDSVRLAMRAYKELHDNLRIPPEFVIPSTVMWPREIWGMKFGLLVRNIRRGRSYTSMREELEAMGLDYTLHHKYFGKELVLTALNHYKEIHGDLNVKVSFCVPVDGKREGWPEEVWGMKLGSTVSSIRGGKCYVNSRKDFENVGFNYDKQKVHYGASVVMIAMQQYVSMHGNFSVPVRFCVPFDSTVWPAVTWGMKLGVLRRNMSNGKCYSVLKDELQSLGFQYKKSRHGMYDELGLSSRDALTNPVEPVVKMKRKIGHKIGSAVAGSRGGKNKLEASTLSRKARADAQEN